MTRPANPWIPCLVVACLALALASPPGAAQSNAPHTTVEGLVGESVAIFFRGLPNSGGREIIQVHGKVRAASSDGLWLDPTMRYFDSKKGEEYTGPLYLPWTSISFVRVLPT